MLEEFVLYWHDLYCRVQHRDHSLTAGKPTVTFPSESLQLCTLSLHLLALCTSRFRDVIPIPAAGIVCNSLEVTDS